MLYYQLSEWSNIHNSLRSDITLDDFGLAARFLVRVVQNLYNPYLYNCSGNKETKSTITKKLTDV